MVPSTDMLSPDPVRVAAAPALHIPASFFGMPVGIVALGLLWRTLGQRWPAAQAIATVLVGAGTGLWVVIAIPWARRWFGPSRAAARAELDDPVQCCFAGLVGVSALLVGIGLLPASRTAAAAFVVLGAAWVLAFALWRTGRLWMGGRDPASTTAVLYLPTVAGGFVTASAFAALGQPEAGQLAFGGAFFSWLAIESVLLHRLFTAPELPPRLRPTLGIQLAPPAVGAVAYLNVTGGHGDVLARALVGYALLQAMLLVRLAPWLRASGATPSWWGVTFGAAALPTAVARLGLADPGGVLDLLVPWLAVAGTLVTSGVIAMTAVLLVRGRLLPRPG